MIINCLFVGLGGAVGSVFRYLISLFPFLHKGLLPFQTLAANILGAILIGMIVGFSESCEGLSHRTLLFLKVGVCGGFTTFSTFALESFDFIEGGKPLVFVLYAALSIALCLGAICVGKWLATQFGA